MSDTITNCMAEADETLRHPKTLIKDLTGGWGNDGQGV